VLQTKQSGSGNPGSGKYSGKGLNGIGGQNRPDTNGINDFFDGSLAECAQWDAALTQGEVDSLQHMRPTFVQPENLRSYVPLHEAIDEFGKSPQDSPNWTATANPPTEVDDHAPVTMFQSPAFGQTIPVAGGNNLSPLINHYYTHLLGGAQFDV
jgi:hypothetical protein